MSRDSIHPVHCRGQTDFLAIPKEIRDIIVGYAVQNDIYTISASKCAPHTAGIASLGSGWAPVARYGYDRELMQSTMLDQVEPEESDHDAYFSTLQALRATCKQLRDEVQEYMTSARVQKDDRLRDAPLDLYLTFPHGVCAVVEQAPQLLKRVRSIKIASVFDLQQLPQKQPLSTYAAPRQTPKADSRTKDQLLALSLLVNFLMGGRESQTSQGIGAMNSPASLGFAKSLLREPFGMSTAIKPDANRTAQRDSSKILQARMRHLAHGSKLSRSSKRLPLEHFQCRILHPSKTSPHDTHASLWTNPNAPTSKVLRSIPGGPIWVSTARGEQSTMVEIEAVPNARDPLVVTSLWPSRFVEGIPGLLASRWIEAEPCSSYQWDTSMMDRNDNCGWASYAPGTPFAVEPPGVF